MDFTKFLITLLLVCLLIYESYVDAASEEQDFSRTCSSHHCSKHGPEIRFPFRLSINPPSCGAPGMQLSCSGHDTILDHHVLGPCRVTEIYYRHRVINVVPLVEPSMQCPLQKLISRNLATDVYEQPQSSFPTTLVRCSRDFIPIDQDSIVGPAFCLGNNASQFWYLASASAYMSDVPWDCVAVSKDIPIPFTYDKHGINYDEFTFNEKANRVINIGETTFKWYGNNITNACQQCEYEDQHCGFNSRTHQAFCQQQASSVAAFVVLSLIVATVIYLSLKSRYNEEINMKVEMFLKAYGTSKPTRYNFPDVKKIARRFKDKLGQGGFGSVYKGKLPNGVPVAVKMLESSTGEGEEFINEVATIGLIHHANIVRLLGFCSEGMRRALIYEFMPNESLEKYIFSHISDISRQLLAPNKMLDIALGIARGIEYLHQGCNQRILHFDIKPHNILLDYNFNPKISDFGLAKLCARDQSIVTLTAARGTMGYIAPEVYSRNFGGVSYKSDVYSFGMLVLEMVSGRRNSDPGVENQDEIYLPEWIYERVISGHEWELTLEMTAEDKEKMRQLTIVALWCIQWNPKNRPSMTKVVNMLTGRLQNLQIPPKPFVSSENHTVPQNTMNT
ncbi:rust resistance kinase Lr10-like isoform X2 [Triticum aestivum]|uniref:rust resistance kinase Lr10-like isoform X2 n=1 Tax=Triticum aestivum TaxID=4565 RepID=UPI001D035539|nr:rust resistance kinase Lr10-like isoform X2 [Triticum aestivum]XP_044446372.1 rust resistance kinase Lr10-like isoform X2 [Triticum aestivum]